MVTGLKFGQVPCLIVDGKEIFQSAAIFRYIAQTFDASGSLYPTDPAIASEVDGLLDQIKDMLQSWGPLRYRERFGFGVEDCPDVVADKCRKTYLTEVMPRHLSFFDKQLTTDPSTPYLLGSSPTIADFALACQLKTFVDNEFDGIKVKMPTSIIKLLAAIEALPAVVAFRASEAK